MYRINLVVVFTFLTTLLYSQSYKATYEVKFKEGFSKEKMKKGLEKELDGKESQLYKKFIADAQPVQSILKFDNTQSFYQVKQTMKNDNNPNNIFSGFAGGERKYFQFKDEDLKYYVSEKFGNIYNVKYKSKKWKLTNQRKIVNGYPCQKAIINTSNGKKIIAWFSKELSFPFGPEKFNGLPGLIIKVIVEPFVFELIKLKKQENELDLNSAKDLISFEKYKNEIKKGMPGFFKEEQ